MDNGSKDELAAEELWVAALIFNAALETATANGLEGLTDDLLSLALEGDPWQLEHGVLLHELGQSALCRVTAKAVFALLSGPPQPFVFNPEKCPTTISATQIAAAAKHLAEDVHQAATTGERAVYRVAYANHEFVVVTTTKRVEILQSFQGAYSVGWCLTNSWPYEPSVFDEAFKRLTETTPLAKALQRLLFGRSLDGENNGTVFNYEKAALRNKAALDADIREHVQVRLAAYQRRKPAPAG